MLRSLALIATLALAGALPHSMRRHKTLDRLSDELTGLSSDHEACAPHPRPHVPLPPHGAPADGAPS